MTDCNWILVFNLTSTYISQLTQLESKKTRGWSNFQGAGVCQHFQGRAGSWQGCAHPKPLAKFATPDRFFHCHVRHAILLDPDYGLLASSNSLRFVVNEQRRELDKMKQRLFFPLKLSVSNFIVFESHLDRFEMGVHAHVNFSDVDNSTVLKGEFTNDVIILGEGVWKI